MDVDRVYQLAGLRQNLLALIYSLSSKASGLRSCENPFGLLWELSWELAQWSLEPERVCFSNLLGEYLRPGAMLTWRAKCWSRELLKCWPLSQGLLLPFASPRVAPSCQKQGHVKDSTQPCQPWLKQQALGAISHCLQNFGSWAHTILKYF